ncbi:hypothetical protein PoB_001335700 [Plakobranchus ocellatus]|uniref:Chitin-binding type-1 domain-containing protein n=1 Tax=Plakobranchus ocellatus TaxID=259542 RepID=A0AAV3YV76_9GAST|nr:hypothetical protein PoB_001335700 [Plakobranchus ocellatus]
MGNTEQKGCVSENEKKGEWLEGESPEMDLYKVGIKLLYVSCVMALCLHQTQARRYRSCDEGCCIHEYCAYHRICYPKIHCRFGCPDGTCVGQESTDNKKDPPTVNLQGNLFQTNHFPTASMSSPQMFEGNIDMGTSVKEKGGLNSDSSSSRPKIQSKFQGNSFSGKRYLNRDNEVPLQDSDAATSSANSETHNQIEVPGLSRRHVPNTDSGGFPDREKLVINQLGKYSAAKDIAKDLPGNNGICMPSPPCKVGDYCGMGHVCTFNYNLGYHTCQYNLEIGSTLCYDKDGKLNLQLSS